MQKNESTKKNDAIIHKMHSKSIFRLLGLDLLTQAVNQKTIMDDLALFRMDPRNSKYKPMYLN